jgi:hypothetical protein
MTMASEAYRDRAYLNLRFVGKLERAFN